MAKAKIIYATKGEVFTAADLEKVQREVGEEVERAKKEGGRKAREGWFIGFSLGAILALCLAIMGMVISNTMEHNRKNIPAEQGGPPSGENVVDPPRGAPPEGGAGVPPEQPTPGPGYGPTGGPPSGN
jgi:hypothetical protein